MPTAAQHYCGCDIITAKIIKNLKQSIYLNYKCTEHQIFAVINVQKPHRQKCKSTIDCATRSSHQASRGPLRDAQFIVIHRRSIDICAWDYGTIYGWQSTNLSQSLLATGTVHSLRAFLNGRLRACLRACLRTCFRAVLGRAALGRAALGRVALGRAALGRAAHRMEERFPREALANGRL